MFREPLSFPERRQRQRMMNEDHIQQSRTDEAAIHHSPIAVGTEWAINVGRLTPSSSAPMLPSGRIRRPLSEGKRPRSRLSSENVEEANTKRAKTVTVMKNFDQRDVDQPESLMARLDKSGTCSLKVKYTLSQDRSVGEQSLLLCALLGKRPKTYDEVISGSNGFRVMTSHNYADKLPAVGRKAPLDQHHTANEAQQFDLNSGLLEEGDVLEDFDFDSFLNPGSTGMLDFTSGIDGPQDHSLYINEDVHGTSNRSMFEQSENDNFNLTNTRPQSPQVTSYWSGLERQTFRHLVADYGRDYAKIADNMQTKSQAMVKNFYVQEVLRGDIQLRKLALTAEYKIGRGERGWPPSPIAPPKRKYDSTTSIPTQTKPSTISTEITNVEMERGMSATKHSLADPRVHKAIENRQKVRGRTRVRERDPTRPKQVDMSFWM